MPTKAMEPKPNNLRKRNTFPIPVPMRVPMQLSQVITTTARMAEVLNNPPGIVCSGRMALNRYSENMRETIAKASGLEINIQVQANRNPNKSPYINLRYS
jgi:hypothetical protein